MDPSQHVHTLVPTYFKNPSWCSHCGLIQIDLTSLFLNFLGTFIWGITPGQQKGWKCTGCDSKFHGYCHDQIEGQDSRKSVQDDQSFSEGAPDVDVAEAMMQSSWALIKDQCEDEETRRQCKSTIFFNSLVPVTFLFASLSFLLFLISVVFCCFFSFCFFISIFFFFRP